jgi:hypothetical protein
VQGRPPRATIAGVPWLPLLYLAGVLVGLWRVDAGVPTRAGVALAWPLGVLAAAVTLPLMILAGLILFPRVGLAVVILALAAWGLVR